MLLNFRAGESAAGADGTVVDQRAAFDDLRAVIDGHFGILKHAVGVLVSDAQFGNLARAARGGILMALAAGLRVVQRAQSVGKMLDLFKRVLIRGVRGVVSETVTLVIR